MRQRPENIKESLFCLCTKYHTVLRTTPAWCIDMLLDAVWRERLRETYHGDGNATIAAEEIINSSYDERLSILLEELKVLHANLRDLGVSMPEALRMISPERKISAMSVERDGTLVFPDYRLTVRLTPLQATLYIVILRHEEGISPKEIVDYKEEITEVMQQVMMARARTTNSQRQEEKLERLFDVTTGALNENVSRIKRTLTNEIGDESIARYYYINSLRLHKLRIPIDRELVGSVY